MQFEHLIGLATAHEPSDIGYVAERRRRRPGEFGECMVVVALEGIEKRVANKLGPSVTFCCLEGKCTLTQSTTAEAEMAMDEPDSGGMRCIS